MSLRRPIAVTVIAVLVAVACAVGLGFAWQRYEDDQQLDRNRAQVARQAGPLVAQLFSTDTAKGRDQARAAVTPGFAQQYAAVLDAEPPAGVTIEWKPVHTGISGVGENRADVVVSALVTETVPGSAPTTATKVVDVELERSGGQWKIARADEVL